MGQRLKISVASVPNSPLVYHTVQRGDTLAALSRRYNVRIAAIKSSNGLTGDRIYVGQRLLIPQRLGYPTATPLLGPTRPTRERIQFALGAISATVSGSPSAIEPKRYVLGARGGQTMTVSLSVDNANVYITVLNPNGENMAGADGPIHNWAGELQPNRNDSIVDRLY